MLCICVAKKGLQLTGPGPMKWYVRMVDSITGAGHIKWFIRMIDSVNRICLWHKLIISHILNSEATGIWNMVCQECISGRVIVDLLMERTLAFTLLWSICNMSCHEKTFGHELSKFECAWHKLILSYMFERIVDQHNVGWQESLLATGHKIFELNVVMR